MKVGARLAAGFAVLVLLLAGITALGVWRLAGLYNATDAIANDRYPRVANAYAIQDGLTRTSVILHQLLIVDVAERARQLSALENLLNGWCGPGRPPAAPAVSDSSPPETADSSASGDATTDQPADLASVFLQTMRDDLAELENVVRQQDRDRAARIAHRMRGAALVCKWPRIAAYSLTIEQELKGAADFGKVADAIAELSLALENDTSK